MEKLPLIISAALFTAWAIVALTATGRYRVAARSSSLGLSLLQLGSAVWAAVRVFTEPSGVKWGGSWFAVSSGEVFEASVAVDALGAVLWLMLSVFLAMFAYFALLEQLHGEHEQSRGEAVALPIMGLGSLIVLCATNFLTFYFGWALISAMGFLAVSLSAPSQEERGDLSFRYAILSVFSESFFLAGMISVFAGIGTLSFAEANEKAASGIPSWSVVCLVVGFMLRSLQMPLVQTMKQLVVARKSSLPVLFIGYAAASSAIFTKIYPIIVSNENMQFLAIIPALTGLFAALLALPAQEPTLFVGTLLTYVFASVFLSGLMGDYQAAQALAIGGGAGVFFFATALTGLSSGERGARWPLVIGALILTGFPASSWGWARYLEYLGLLHSENRLAPLQGTLAGVKILADLVMGVALWRVVRERWLAKVTESKIRWEAVVPVLFLGLANLSISVGGRPFGGVLGAIPIDSAPEIAWFERLVQAPGSLHVSSAAIDLQGTDTDILARILVVSVLLFPATLSILWLFRDGKAMEDFHGFCKNVVSKLKGVRSLEMIFWEVVLPPLKRAVARFTAFFDLYIIDYLMADLWLRPARFIRRAFAFFETAVLDRGVVDGLAAAVGTIGKSLRLVQNGQVQFYFALGLLLMAAIVIKFVRFT